MNEAVAELQKQSPFLRAFSGSKEVQHTIENTSSADNHSFIENIQTANFDYICNIKIGEEIIALKAPKDKKGVRFYCTKEYDANKKDILAISSDSHDETTIMLGKTYGLILACKAEFERGRVRFSDIETKEKAFAFLMLSW